IASVRPEDGQPGGEHDQEQDGSGHRDRAHVGPELAQQGLGIRAVALGAGAGGFGGELAGTAHVAGLQRPAGLGQWGLWLRRRGHGRRLFRFRHSGAHVPSTLIERKRMAETSELIEFRRAFVWLLCGMLLPSVALVAFGVVAVANERAAVERRLAEEYD